MKRRLIDCASTEYSQYGEEGITDEIFARIGTRSRVCVEIGAWDGLHLSNTAHYWKRGWNAVLVEGDPKKFAVLTQNTAGHDCVLVNAMVTPEGPTALEAILESNGVPCDFDLLCIDIDGDDYFLFESLRSFRPRVVICEYNPTVPAHMDVHAARGNYFGCSAGALARLGAERGYRLVCLTDTNVILVLAHDAEKLSDFELDPDRIRIDRHLTYVVTSYAGDYLLAGRSPFGLNYRYRGQVHGECRPARFKWGWGRLVRPLRRLLARFRS